MKQGSLAKDIKTRHLVMIGFGGAIGVGFFVGTGETISQAGALGALIAYFVGSVIIYSVLLSLGEMGSYLPNTGSFGDYAQKFINPFAGYYVYWAYWLNCVLGNAIQFIGIGFLMQKWFPDSPLWLWIILSCALVFVANAYKVKFFAEVEFYLSAIKVGAILIFLICGLSIIAYNFYTLGLSLDSFYHIFQNFYDSSKHTFFPNGLIAVFSAIVFISYAFAGTEVIGVAIGETKDPHKAMPYAVKATMWRLLVFFIGSVFIVSTFLPYSDARITESPFVAVLDIWNVPYAGSIMNFVIIIAILSSSNTGIYGSARMFYSLSQKGFLPKVFSKVNKNQIPMYSLVVSTIVSLISLLCIWIDPQEVINALIIVAGLSMMLVWMSVGISQYNFRKWYLNTLGKKLEDLPYRTPFTPYTQIIGIFGCAIPIVVSSIEGTYRISVWYTLALVGVCYIGYCLTNKFNKNINNHISDDELLQRYHTKESK